MAVIKGGSSFSSYLFDNLTFTSSPHTGEGTFEITFLNGGGKIPDLSHLTLYWANAGACCSNQVPEPGTIGMLALGGLALLGFSRRRPKVTRG